MNLRKQFKVQKREIIDYITDNMRPFTEVIPQLISSIKDIPVRELDEFAKLKWDDIIYSKGLGWYEFT
jgi:hypothetical protein